MTKNDFIKSVSRKSGLTQKVVEQSFNAMLEVLEETVMSGDKLTVTGFCTIGVKTVAPKSIINPVTKEKMMTRESRTLSIKTGAILKDKLNK